MTQRGLHKPSLQCFGRDLQSSVGSRVVISASTFALPVLTRTGLTEAAAELVSLVPDAIVVTGPQSLRAANLQTQRIPIVAAAVRDPVALGMV